MKLRPFNIFKNFDRAVLIRLDKIVLWIWNRFELRRIWLIRASFLSWIFGWVGSMAISAKAGELHIAQWTMIVLNFALFFMNERTAKKSAIQQNMTVVSLRVSTATFFLRWFFYFLFASNSLANFGAEPNTFLNHAFYAFDDIGWVGYMLFPYAWVPMEPPKRKIKIAVPQLKYALAKF